MRHPFAVAWGVLALLSVVTLVVFVQDAQRFTVRGLASGWTYSGSSISAGSGVDAVTFFYAGYSAVTMLITAASLALLITQALRWRPRR